MCSSTLQRGESGNVCLGAVYHRGCFPLWPRGRLFCGKRRKLSDIVELEIGPTTAAALYSADIWSWRHARSRAPHLLEAIARASAEAACNELARSLTGIRACWPEAEGERKSLTQWFSQRFMIKAGPKLLAGFNEAPEAGIFRGRRAQMWLVSSKPPNKDKRNQSTGQEFQTLLPRGETFFKNTKLSRVKVREIRTLLQCSSQSIYLLL